MHPSQAYKVPRKSAEHIINLALHTRQGLDLSVSSGIKPDRFLELLMGVYALNDKAGFEIVETSEMAELGKYDPMKDVVKIRNDVYENATEGCIESLYTITHEFGHMILHAGAGFCRLEHLSLEQIEQLHPDEHSEEQTDLFACALHLHPEQVVELSKAKQSILSISEMYKIPIYLLERYVARLINECGYKINLPMTGQMELKLN